MPPANKYSDDAKMALIAGLVGRDIAISYSQYNCPVRPRDMITHGVEQYRKLLKTLNRSQMTGLTWGMVSFLKGKVDDEKNAKVAIDFAKYLVTEHGDKDIAVAFCNLMVGGTNIKARSALVSNPAVSHLISRFRAGSAKKTFADRLNEEKGLQGILSNCAWGKEPQ